MIIHMMATAGLIHPLGQWEYAMNLRTGNGWWQWFVAWAHH